MDLLHPEGCCRFKKLIVAPRAYMYFILLVKSQHVVKMYRYTRQGGRNGKQHSDKKSVGNHNRSLMTVIQFSNPILSHH